ncbi:hypothetical protein BDZ89DRAFT_1065638 [Hymenopellis radicata]|nr:hypothetical protein BDZ89DRAFT_1065638 [Hymenopellis radicata]
MASVSDSATQKLRTPARRALHRMLSWNDSRPWPRRIRRKRQSGPTGESTTGPSAEEALITILMPSSSSTFASMPPSSRSASSSTTSSSPLSSVTSNSGISSIGASSSEASSSSSSVASTSGTSSSSFTSIHPSFSSSSSSLSFSLSSSESFTFSSTSYSWSASPTSLSSMTNASPPVQFTTLTTIHDETITVEPSQSSFTSQFEPVNPSTRTITSVSSTSSGVLSTNSPGEGNSLSRNTGAIVGVALAVAVVLISAAFLVFFGCRRYRKLHSPNQGSWRPPLGDDDSERLSVAGQAALRRATLPNVESSEPLTRSSTQNHAFLSRRSSEGQQLSSLDHSSGESSTHALLSPMSRVGYFGGDAPPSSFIPPPERAHRIPGVADIVIPQPAQLPSLPRSPSSPTSIYSNHASLLNPPLVAPTMPAIVVSPDPAPQWPPPPVHLPSFGSSSELPRLLQNNSYISFRDDADYSRPIVGLGGAVDVSDDEDDISTAPRAL